MSMITISHLSFSYDTDAEDIFRDVSLELDTDWKLGLVGRNGRGKTTLLRLLMGRYEYRGSITAATSFAYFPFQVEAANTGREIGRMICADAQDWQVERELSLLNLSPDVLERPLESLSFGEQTKILLALQFLKKENFLLIDEPTNHLDQTGREVVSKYLNRKRGFILVSHDRAFLDGCVDHILSINRANIEIQRGNYSSFEENRRRVDAFERARNEKLKREANRLEEAARQTKGWSDAVERTKKGTRSSGLRPDRGYIGRKSAKMMQRSKSTQARREKALEEKKTLLKNIEADETLKITPLADCGQRILEAQDLCLYYGERKVCGPISFVLERGDRIAVAGKNGSGKSTLMRLVAGEKVSYTGKLLRSGRVVASYVGQDASYLDGSLEDYARELEVKRSQLLTILRKMGFPRQQFEKDIDRFSEGQKKKVLLAGSLCQRAHLYLWDEPLNYIDILCRIQIEEVILEAQPTMLFIEHDAAFVKKVATQVLKL